MKGLEAAVRELRSLDTRGEPVLSILLPVPRGADGTSQLLSELKLLTRSLLIGRSPAERAEIQREILTVRHALVRLQPAHGGIAAYLSTGLRMLRIVRLPMAPVPAAVREAEPLVQPLEEMLDECERAVVLLVDRSRARFFRVCRDRVAELEQMATEPALPARVAGGAQPVRGLAMREVVDRLRRMVKREQAGRILLGGSLEARSEVLRLLQSLGLLTPVSEIALPVASGSRAVLTAVRAALERIDMEEEQRLLDDVEERVGRGEAVVGASDSVAAVMGSNAQLLIHNADAHVPALVCSGCDQIYTLPAPATCPLCGADLLPEADAVARLRDHVVRSGGMLEELHGAAATRLARSGGVAVLLRYPAPRATARTH